MIKLIIFSLSFFIYFHALACELKQGDISIVLHHEKKGCEFPEGNKLDCAFFSVTKKSVTRKSSVVFREGADWKTYCLTVKEGEKGRELSPFKEASIQLDCSSRGETMHFLLKVEAEEKSCELKL